MKLHLMPKMLLFILLPSLLGLAIIGIMSKNIAEKGLLSQIDEDMSVLATIQARELTNIISLLQNTTINLSENEYIRKLLIAFKNNNNKETQILLPSAMLSIQEVKKNYIRIRDVGIVDSYGKVVAHTVNNFIGTDMSNRNYVQEALNGKGSAQLVKSKVDSQITTVLASPVLVNNVPVGLIYVTLEMESIAKSTTNAIKVAKTGICYVYDKTGTTIIHPDRALIGDDNKAHPWTWEIVKNNKNIVNYTWQDVNKIAYAAKVEGVDWYVVLAVTESDILAPITAMTKTLVILSLITAILVSLAIILMAKNIVGALKRGVSFTQNIVNDNFEISSKEQAALANDSTRTDEIGELAQAIKLMTQHLQNLFKTAEIKNKEVEEALAEAEKAKAKAEEATKQAEQAKKSGMLAAAAQLEGAVNIISSASTQLEAQISRSEQGAAEQAARVAETATAMEEMNSTVLEVAKNASIAADVSLNTRKKAESGATIVLNSVNSIKQVHEQAMQLKQDMTKLDENAQSISQIMSVISDIADQTNLLALNAAIEAARAGDAGRGFAVVADEVRKLAEKTMASTTDVGNAIKSIQQSASVSASQVDASGKSIEESTNFAHQSGEALKEIVSLVDSTADQVRAIATASEQQSASSEEINRSIAIVNTIANENSIAMNEAAKAVTDLVNQAQVLNKLIGDMKHS